MGEKLIKGMTKNLCQRFVGYAIQPDLEVLEGIGPGWLVIDLIAGAAERDGTTRVEPAYAHAGKRHDQTVFLFECEATVHRVPIETVGDQGRRAVLEIEPTPGTEMERILRPG